MKIKEIALGTVCDILVVCYMAASLVFVFGIPLLALFLSVALLKWATIILIPIILMLPSIMMTWLDERKLMNAVFKNSNSFYGW